VDEAGVDAVIDELLSNDRTLRHYIDGLDIDRFEYTPVARPTSTRTYIPVTAE
jgi:hypothetical protein